VDNSHEVWARAAVAVVDMAVRAGIPPAGLFEGLELGAADLRRRKRVRWDDYCTLLERLAAIGPIDELIERTYHEVTPEVRAVAGAIIGPKAFYRFVIEIIDPMLFPPIVCRCEELDGNRVRIEASLRQGARPCAAYFLASLGAVRGLSRHLGLPSARVIDADLGPDHLSVELELPPSRTLVTRARRRLRVAIDFALGHEPDGTPVNVTVGEPATTPDERLVQATAEWGLTPRQSEVLALVVRGDANKAIAVALGCAESTVELHVTHLLRRAEVTSRAQLVARFWMNPT
jgi:DNA-binding CsgD family transcriptional regulator